MYLTRFNFRFCFNAAALIIPQRVVGSKKVLLPSGFVNHELL